MHIADDIGAVLDHVEAVYRSGTTHAFLMSGNVGDDHAIGCHVGRLPSVVATYLARSMDAVAVYSLADGLVPIDGPVDVWPRVDAETPVPQALRAIRAAMAGQDALRCALVLDGIDDLGALVPRFPGDGAVLQNLERLADDPLLTRLDHVVVGRLGAGSARWARIEVLPPGREARLDEIRALIEDGSAPQLDGITPGTLADLTAGTTRLDLRREIRSRSRIDAAAAYEIRAGGIRRQAGGMLEPVTPLAAWPPGLEHVRGALERSIRVDGSFSSHGARGVLLVGPPGTGKTFALRALAGSRPIPVLAMRTVRAGLVGESERNLETIARTLRGCRPVVVFIDEIDQMVGSRDDGQNADGGVDRRLMGRMLELIEETRREGSVLWVGATNRVGALDEAIRSRLSRTIAVLPPGPRTRARVLAAIAASLTGVTAAGVDWGTLAATMRDTSPRDMEGVVRLAAELGDGTLTPATLDAAQAAHRRGDAALARAACREALSHVRFATDMPDDLPEFLTT
jgi:Cdc6-like AAA superfamily ATPase